jgi:hypothetical protein
LFFGKTDVEESCFHDGIVIWGRVSYNAVMNNPCKEAFERLQEIDTAVGRLRQCVGVRPPRAVLAEAALLLGDAAGLYRALLMIAESAERAPNG